MEMPNHSQTNTTTTTTTMSPPQKPMSKEQLKMYVHCSMEWRVDERIRSRGKSKGKTDTYYHNHILKKQFRSLEDVAKYIETRESPQCNRRRETTQNAVTKAKGSTSEATKADSMGDGEQRKHCVVEPSKDFVVVDRKVQNFKKMKERARWVDLTRSD